MMTATDIPRTRWTLLWRHYRLLIKCMTQVEAILTLSDFDMGGAIALTKVVQWREK